MPCRPTNRAQTSRRRSRGGSRRGYDGTVAASPGAARCASTRSTRAGRTPIRCSAAESRRRCLAFPAHQPVGRAGHGDRLGPLRDRRRLGRRPRAVASPVRCTSTSMARGGGRSGPTSRDPTWRPPPGGHGPPRLRVDRARCQWGRTRSAPTRSTSARGATNPGLGCRTVTSAGPRSAGSSGVTPTPGQVQIEGWAIDPDTADPIGVHVYVDGVFKRAAIADGDRPDVETGWPGNGGDARVRRHAAGARRHPDGLRVRDQPVQRRRQHATGLQHGDVPATTFLPIGNIDSVTPVCGHHGHRDGLGAGQGRDDRRRPGARVRGRVMRASVTANRPRADIATAYPGAGSTTVGRPRRSRPRAATHKVCAYGINIHGGVVQPAAGAAAVRSLGPVKTYRSARGPTPAHRRNPSPACVARGWP